MMEEVSLQYWLLSPYFYSLLLRGRQPSPAVVLSSIHLCDTAKECECIIRRISSCYISQEEHMWNKQNLEWNLKGFLAFVVGGQTLSYMAFTYQGHSSLTPTHLSPLQRRRSSCWVSYCSAERHGDRKRDRDGERGVVVAERSLFVILFLLIPFFHIQTFYTHRACLYTALP